MGSAADEVYIGWAMIIVGIFLLIIGYIAYNDAVAQANNQTTVAGTQPSIPGYITFMIVFGFLLLLFGFPLLLLGYSKEKKPTYTLTPTAARQVLTDVQKVPVTLLPAVIEDLTLPIELKVQVRVVKPPGHDGSKLPLVVYF